MDYMPAKYRLPLRRREAPSHPSQSISSESLHNSLADFSGRVYKTIFDYTRGKLLAMARLAEEHQQLMNAIYHAGRWESKLVTKLLWGRNSPSNLRPLFPRPAEIQGTVLVVGISG
jgi:hypothetical protein